MQDQNTTIIVLGGTGTATLHQFYGETVRIRVIPPSESATYNVSITDDYGSIVFSAEEETGTLTEDGTISTKVIKTVTITGATEDGNYRLALDIGRAR